jgi:threonine dehydratase
MVDIDAIGEALRSIAPHVHRTPLIYSNSFSRLTGSEVFLKAENLQKTGSFKVRGAFNKLRNVSSSAVVVASMGNHAQGVAYASCVYGKKAKIIMPRTAPIVKQEAAQGYGAEVVLHGENFQESLAFALQQTDYTFIHPFDDDEIMAGQGTVGMEIMQDMTGVDAVLVPVGGGGLIAGIAVAVKAVSPGTRVVGIQTKAAPSAYLSLREKKICERAAGNTLADGIALARVGERPFEIMSRYVDDMVLVDEDAIAMSILLFLERKKLVVEGAGAVPLAALLAEQARFAGKKVVLVVSGGNIDFSLIDRIIHKGLLRSGRIGVFDAIVDDLPGRLHEITGVISSHGGNILNVAHDRLSSDLAIGRTTVSFVVETKGKAHLEEILADLSRSGVEVRRKEG